MYRTIVLVALSLLAVVGCEQKHTDSAFRPYAPDPLLATPQGQRVPIVRPDDYRPPRQKPSRPTSQPLKGRKIIVDAGHGGKDPGAIANGVYEKSITLPVTQKLGAQLETLGATVLYTRTTDVFIELDDRVAVAKRNRPALFLSIHADSIHKPSITGSTLYVSPGLRWSSDAKKAARAIQKSFKKTGIECRGVNDTRDFRVLVGHQYPSILIETGYITNPVEAKRLNQSWYQDKLVKAIADGIAAYFN